MQMLGARDCASDNWEKKDVKLQERKRGGIQCHEGDDVQECGL